MARTPRPSWEPIPDPPGPDLATAQEFAVLAEEHAAQLDAGADSFGATMGEVETARVQGDASTAVIGQDLATLTGQVGSEESAAAADTLVAELQRAGEQDDALLGVAGEAATALGEAQPVPEPQPAPPAPPAPYDPGFTSPFRPFFGL